LLDRGGLHARREHGTDDAEAIPRGAQENRNAAGDREALLDALVAIAVAERDLAIADARAHDRTVRSRRAVEHGVPPVRAGDARRVALARADGPRVPEQGAERGALDPHVGAEEILAIEIEEDPADRRFEERDAPLMPRRGPRVLDVAIVLAERGDERRQ